MTVIGKEPFDLANQRLECPALGISNSVEDPASLIERADKDVDLGSSARRYTKRFDLFLFCKLP